MVPLWLWSLIKLELSRSAIQEHCSLLASFQAPPSFSVLTSTDKRERAWDNLLRAWRQGREKGRENLIERGHIDCKYAARSQLIRRLTVSCMEIGGSRALAVYVNSKCRERLIQSWKRVLLALNLATSQQGHGTALLASHAEPACDSGVFEHE